MDKCPLYYKLLIFSNNSRIDKYITKDIGKDNVFMVDSSKAAQNELIKIAEMVSERGTEHQMPETNQRPFPKSVTINYFVFFILYIHHIFIYLLVFSLLNLI